MGSELFMRIEDMLRDLKIFSNIRKTNFFFDVFIFALSQVLIGVTVSDLLWKSNIFGSRIFMSFLWN